MAWIKNFETRDGKGKTQPSNVVGLIKIFEATDGRPTAIQLCKSTQTDQSIEPILENKAKPSNWVGKPPGNSLTFSSAPMIAHSARPVGSSNKR